MRRSPNRVSQGERRLVVLRREDLWAVRDFDPQACLHGLSGPRGGTVRLSPGSAGTLPGLRAGPQHPGREHRGPRARSRPRRGDRLRPRRRGSHAQGAGRGDGSLWAAFADATSGDSSHRFGFLRPAAPSPERSVSVASAVLLPPCAFAGHFVCPFPPPGNTLPVRSRPANGTARDADPS
ncbi:DUF1684 domain-containing protein [Streptomyces sp. NBC_00390]|uniref:DUF1684 domain-containing protein n=1 Tax=Streptomyces sp. NBC_00390 TaxID=2975736 RepID=UPI002E209A22